MFYDVIVVGAGPSGSHLAANLARRGYGVLVIEKKPAAGIDICCTGIVSRKCLKLLEVPQSLVIRPVSEVRVVAPSGKSFQLQRHDSEVFVIDRPTLDRLLADRARSAGASYMFSTYVTEVQAEADSVAVQSESQDDVRVHRAQLVVLACGFGSSLPARLGLGRIDDFIIGAQAEVEVNGGEMEIYLDAGLAPGSFAWLVPTSRGKGLAGLMTRYQPRQRLKGLLHWLEAQGKIVSGECRQGYGAIPLRPLTTTFASRVLVVGEAAGQVKPLTGGGIYYGALCADIAAEVIDMALARGDFAEQALACYQQMWRHQLGKELRFGYLLYRLYQRMSNREIEWAHSLAARCGIADFVRRAEPAYFDYHSRAASGMMKYFTCSLLSGRFARGQQG
jgi:digeranylgeranylglycerophospholipid reductase